MRLINPRWRLKRKQKRGWGHDRHGRKGRIHPKGSPKNGEGLSEPSGDALHPVQSTYSDGGEQQGCVRQQDEVCTRPHQRLADAPQRPVGVHQQRLQGVPNFRGRCWNGAMKPIYQCPICKRYRCTDGDYVHLKPKEMAILILFGDKVEFIFKTCPDCEGENYERH